MLKLVAGYFGIGAILGGPLMLIAMHDADGTSGPMGVFVIGLTLFFAWPISLPFWIWAFLTKR